MRGARGRTQYGGGFADVVTSMVYGMPDKHSGRATFAHDVNMTDAGP